MKNKRQIIARRHARAGGKPAGAAAPATLRLTCTVNGEGRELQIKANELLLEVLRRFGYTGVKEGCREAECGACTVLVDGLPVTACSYPAARAAGKAIITIEGLERDGQLHRLQEAFLDAGAVQCGFCTPGMLLSARALLERMPRPQEEDIRSALDGNLCRCTGYVKIIKAVQAAAGGKP